MLWGLINVLWSFFTIGATVVSVFVVLVFWVCSVIVPFFQIVFYWFGRLIRWIFHNEYYNNWKTMWAEVKNNLFIIPDMVFDLTQRGAYGFTVFLIMIIACATAYGYPRFSESYGFGYSWELFAWVVGLPCVFILVCLFSMEDTNYGKAHLKMLGDRD